MEDKRLESLDLGSVEVPPVPRIVASKSFCEYDPIEAPNNIRDDLENSSFPTTARIPANPAARLMELAIVHGDYEAIKQLDSYFIKFEVAKVSMDQIAKALDVSVSMARKFYNAYKERQRKYIERLEVNDILAKSLNSLDEFESELYKIGTTTTEQTKNKISALKAAADIEMKKLESLEKNRFYERKGYAPKDLDNSPETKKDFVLNILQNIFIGEEIDGNDAYKALESQVIDVIPDED